MSSSRPECNDSHKRALPETAALYRVYYAVKKRRGLIHGKLRGDNSQCALGCFWDDNSGAALQTELVEQIATVNDSVPPTVGRRERRQHVLRWLEWKLGIHR